MLSRRSGKAARVRGLSLVELMIGITIGLIVVAGATLLAATQMTENRRLLLETQVQQDLRAAADIITRELRRGGYYDAAQNLVWSPTSAIPESSPNLWRGLEFGANGDEVSYKYWRPGETTQSFGYRLTSGTIRHRIGGVVQDVTDRTALEVTVFTATAQATDTVQLACPKLCSDNTQNCWPTLSLNDVVVTITARPVSDPTFVRTVTSRVRQRNEGINFNVSALEACP